MIGIPLDSSFRDPDGFLFTSKNQLYRQINLSYQKDYDLLMHSGLYEKLVTKQLLIPHRELRNIHKYTGSYKIIKPELIKFVSYPYEWTFSQLKDAALTTLKIASLALDFGLTLKDASSFNIQFYNGKPIFIDTLSFTRLIPNQPWYPYRQFCEHFLGPLALMSFQDVNLVKMMQIHLDGIPLAVIHKILPINSYFSIPLLLHIHFHSNSYNRSRLAKPISLTGNFSVQALRGLLDNLTQAVSNLTWQIKPSTWSDYYKKNSYTKTALREKIQLVKTWITKLHPKTVWDLGANQSLFSRLASEQSIFTIAFDSDPTTSEIAYLQTKKDRDAFLLPLVMDLTNPSPRTGFAHNERLSLIDRGPCELALVLALIHHLAIGHNIPLPKIAAFFARICRYLIIEFVPKNDPMVITMLKNRKDIFPDYHWSAFEQMFGRWFNIQRKVQLKDSERILYNMRLK